MVPEAERLGVRQTVAVDARQTAFSPFRQGGPRRPCGGLAALTTPPVLPNAVRLARAVVATARLRPASEGTA